MTRVISLRESVPLSRRSIAGAATGIALAAPALLLFGLFAIYPIVQVFVLGFFDYNLTSPPTFVGFANFAYLSTDKRFLESLVQTVFYALASYVPAMALALALAHALRGRMAGIGLVRLVFGDEEDRRRSRGQDPRHRLDGQFDVVQGLQDPRAQHDAVL